MWGGMELENNLKYIRKTAYNISLFLKNEFTDKDIFANAFIAHYDNKKPLIKSIIDEVYKAKFIQSGRKQNGRKVSDCYQKQCKKCLKVKNQAYFRHQYSKKFNLHYLDSYCKVCRIEYNKKKYKEYYTNNAQYREKALERSKANNVFNKWRYHNDPEYRQKQLLKAKKYADNKRARKNSS
jgi:hypothetical protein